MKVVRVIKVIAFIVAIIALLVTAAGNFFILKDACDYKGIDVATVKANLDEYDFKFSSLFKKAEAEEEGEAGVPETDEDDAFFPGEADPDYVEPSDEEPAGEETEESAEDYEESYEEANDLPLDDGSYDLSAAHSNPIIGLMKAANWTWTDKKATEFKFENMENYKDGGIASYLNIVWQFGDPNVDFTVNALLTISFGCIVLAFILHLISKNVKKTFYGILLMILGFIIFAVNFVLGNVLGNCVSIMDSTLASYDLGALRIYIIAAFTFLAVLFGLPYIRCGSRQMKIKALKARLKKIRAKKASAQ